ncbi:hypothetical protein [Flavobacterium crassostreae]|uniref:Uncharacterized protein n=1 Tax=Flavobacterium crassostreae TaxID=1763534 RepID=A0A1B9EA91_9FLAO|nr:hypothetical protein [Flavobacterium crassostreae]OCB78818.1 hypothetical protein LPBF_00065 [Flavobacterium crassostreae]
MAQNAKINISNKITPFLKKYGVIIVLFFLLFPYLYKYILKFKNKIEQATDEAKKDRNTAENATGNPAIIKQKVEQVKKKYPNLNQKTINQINTNALKIATAFGTNVDDNHQIGNFEFFNVKAWTEDEETAIRLLKQHLGTFPILEDFYYTTATRSRNLKADVLKYLSKEQSQELSNFYKKRNYFWL